jgi:hypothetical protein
MGVGEPQPFAGQPVEVGRRDFRFRVVTGGIAVTQIIRQNDHDVRQICGFSTGPCGADGDRSQGGNESVTDES